jgi:excinuclease ABC subunit C
VDVLFPGRPFFSFGPSLLDPRRASPACQLIVGRRASQLRALLRQTCPRHPGVYGMLNPKRELVYVGKANCLRSRLLSYFRPKSRDPKAGRILQHTRSIVWEHTPSEFAALLRELELIRRWQPRFNVQGQPSRRRPTYVCLGRRPAPYIFLARRPPAGALASFGPVPASRHAREAVRRLNDWYRLRDCSQAQEMVFAEQGELFPILRSAGCLRYELDACLGPCLAACTRQAYRERVQGAEGFLVGTDRTILEQLEQEMNAASAALAYERAAVLRDKLEAVRWLSDRLDRLQRARERQSFVYPVKGVDGSELWYLIHGGRVLAALPAPRDPQEQDAVGGVIRKMYQQKLSATGPVPADQIDGVFLVAAWFQRHPDERARQLEPAELLASFSRELQASGSAPRSPEARG